MSLSLKNDVLNAVQSSYQPIGDPTTKDVNWPKPPTTGSNAFKPNPNYIPPASVNVYPRETVKYWKERALFYYRKLRALGYNPDANCVVSYSNNFSLRKQNTKISTRRIRYGKSCCKNCKFR